MKKFISILKTRFAVLIIDLLMIPIAWYGAYWLRFNLGEIPASNLLQANNLLPFLFVIQGIAFWIFGLYRGIWGFASLPDFVRIIKSVIIGVLISWLLFFLISTSLPRSIIPLYAWLLVSFLAGTRLLYRWIRNYRSVFKEGKRVLIIGAGSAGELFLRELQKSTFAKVEYNPIVFIDDDPKKQGCELHGIRVVGTIKDLPRVIGKYNIELVIIAIPSAPASTMRNIVDSCEQAKVSFYTIPKLNDLVSGRISVKSLRDVSIEDLLGRDPVNLNWDQISHGLSGNKVLVTGGGGSIGSELCRQIANLAPEQLIIVDSSEFNLYTIDMDLRLKFPHLRLLTLLLDVTDSNKLNDVVKQYQPKIIFHAAAYKHVPLLECQANAAVKNNIYGTRSVAEAAVNNGVETFVLISTDKAVHPTNVMGATKRAAEIICQSYNGNSNTRFITVRFGNVLGSAGSVIPLFRSQLEQGLDITVTHPEISRYFMTIPEAAQLILQATVLGRGNEVFVLDMGEPIKIRDLAEQMIQLSGKKLGEDVNIVYTGLRPGEKLHEELFYESEDLINTECEKILLAKHDLKNLPALAAAISDLIRNYNSLDEQKLKDKLFYLISC